MNYQVYTPSRELQVFVKCFWTLEADSKEEPSRQRVLPDGCMEMIFHYGDLYKQYFEDGSFVVQPRSFIFGQITRYIEIEPTGASGIVSARFHPEGLSPFLKIPVSALENKAVSMGDLFGGKGHDLEKEILSATGNLQRIKIIEQFLLSLLADPGTADTITKNCVDAIFRSQGQIAVADLAGKMNINRRNIERKFAATVGMSPKQLSKAVRLQAALKMLQENNFSSLTSLAYDNGYYDQAHFIKDFKEFTGLSPKSFFAGNLRFATLFASAE
ncbi:MAG: helix-turn-helix transcriptional regulator [Chitinophagaceae bacterium]|nr:helix-turn-helix transcriptional regulator [Chitinophagaceae bacterium]